jgi:hypothetical protein
MIRAMKTTRWQFSLRQLLLVTTTVAVVVMLISHQWRFVVGLATAAVWLLDAFSPAIGMLSRAGSLDELRRRPRKPTEKEIREFAVLYPKAPGIASKSAHPADSK